MITLKEAYDIVKEENPVRKITKYFNTDCSKKYHDLYVFGTIDGLYDSWILCVNKKTGQFGSISFPQNNEIMKIIKSGISYQY